MRIDPWSLIRLIKWLVLLALAIGIAGLAYRAYRSTGGPALQPWHTFVPVELTAADLDRADWAKYMAQEDVVMASVRAEVTDKLDPAVQVPMNRYYVHSPVYSPNFRHDWNRSYVLEPEGVPKGAVVLLHGLTDSPYSLRHIAQRYRDQGFVAIGIRLPGHGTVPSGLTSARWEDWIAATRLAVREARRRVPAPAPLHLVGFSNGGALAMKYSLDALDDSSLPRADRLVLLTPMIGITRFARFAGLAGLPALLPPFANAAWLSIIPEFNPFKYNSFPVHGARQSYLLTDALQGQMQRVARAKRQGGLPPVLTFQSVIDFTVSTPAILNALYANLPDNGSEIVLFDVNRTLKFSPLLRPASYVAVERLAPTTPQPYTFTVITTAGEGSDAAVERTVPPGELEAKVRPLGMRYPPGIYSLSHLAIPIPVNDPLYGTQPDPATRFDYGFNLGALDARGERGALVVDQDFLTRLPSNPFFPYVLARIDEGITNPSRPSGRNIAASGSPGVPVRIEAVLSTLLPPDNEGQAFAGP
jgi:alpha-beta hydrolase superfamily lysophospholipase